MAEIFLIAPPDAKADIVVESLAALLQALRPVALLLPRAQHSESDYKALVKATVGLAQPMNVAVLIEGDPGEVRKLGADGLHVTAGIEALEEAVSALKPDFIVGAANLRTRHEAMSSGELDIDYVFFGPLSGPIDAFAREVARWWAETMEVPSVFSDPEADAGGNSEGCEFLAVGERVWREINP